MESLKCESCSSELTADMEIEYSNQCNASFFVTQVVLLITISSTWEARQAMRSN